MALPAAAAAAAILLLAALAIAAVIRSPARRKRNYPPVAGTIFNLILNVHRYADFLTDISRRHKTFRILTPSCNYVYTVDPHNVEHFLRTNFSNYGKGKINYDVLSGLFGNGIFAVDGDKWRQQRKLASYEFSAKVLRDYSSVVFARTAAKLAGIVSGASESGEPLDFQDLFMRATMDSIFKVGFGVELDTLAGSVREGRDFARAFDSANALVLRRYFDVFWKIKKLLNVGSEALLRNDVKHVDEFVLEIIRRKIEQREQRKDDSIEEKEDILSRFLVEREKDPGNITVEYLKDIVLNFVIAGKDTTAGTLSWFFYMLCRNPGVQEKVAKEVGEVLGAGAGECDDSRVSEEALGKMQYLHAAITETLRLYPSIPLDAKECFSDDIWPDGYEVRKGDLVNYQPYPMGRMRFLWGEDAEEFRPERWLDDDGVFVPASPFKFTAFQAGPRICLGKYFAYVQMKILASCLLHRFVFKMWDETKPVKHKTMLTLQIDGALQLLAIQR